MRCAWLCATGEPKAQSCNGRTLTSAAASSRICTTRIHGLLAFKLLIKAQLKNATPNMAHSRRPQTSPITRSSRNTGSARMTKPNAVFTVSIHGPLFGSRRLPNTVTRISGSPIPRA
ncbi:hypothetical protein D3C76_1509230 [compost metagenome]